MPIGPDPISSIEGGVVGVKPISRLVGNVPVLREGGQLLGSMFSSGKDYNDAPYEQTIGAEAGVPLQAAPMDAPPVF